MLGFKREVDSGKCLTVMFFIIMVIEATAELFSNKLLVFIFKPLLSIVIMALYWNASKKKESMFFVVLTLSLITNLLFISNSENLLFVGLLVFLIHRLLLISYVVRMIKLKDFIPLFIAIVPFLFVFSYLLSISNEIQVKSYWILLIQNVLISLIGGLALSEYVINYNKISSWFLIFGLLSVTQYFIVFIEKYYLLNLAPIVFRPFAMVLNATVYYAFYRFVIDTEKANTSEETILDNN